MRKVWKISGCQVTERFESEEQNFVSDSLGYRESMKLNKNRCNVVSRLGASDDSCSRVLYNLELIKKFFSFLGDRRENHHNNPNER